MLSPTIIIADLDPAKSVRSDTLKIREYRVHANFMILTWLRVSSSSASSGFLLDFLRRRSQYLDTEINDENKAFSYSKKWCEKHSYLASSSGLLLDWETSLVTALLLINFPAKYKNRSATGTELAHNSRGFRIANRNQILIRSFFTELLHLDTNLDCYFK